MLDAARLVTSQCTDHGLLNRGEVARHAALVDATVTHDPRCWRTGQCGNEGGRFLECPYDAAGPRVEAADADGFRAADAVRLVSDAAAIPGRATSPGRKPPAQQPATTGSGPPNPTSQLRGGDRLATVRAPRWPYSFSSLLSFPGPLDRAHDGIVPPWRRVREAQAGLEGVLDGAVSGALG